MDQPVIERAKACRIYTQPFGNTGAKAFDGDVSGFRKLVHKLPPLLGFHIDRNASLVAIGAQKHRAKTGRGKRRPSPRLIPLPHGFDLDNLGAEIAEILRAKGTCEHLRKIENFNAIKRS
jgi:hypothetical protein